MPDSRFLLPLALGMALIPAIVHAELPSLTVNVTGAEPSIGQIEVTLFDSADSFLNTIYLQESGAPDEEGRFTARFAAIEQGDYAVVVVHDENDNKAYDSGFLGFGSEGLGYSNNVSHWFSRPDFDDVKITVSEPETVIEIRLD